MKTALTCKICNNQSHNQSFTAKERMLGLNDNFEYFECANCNCIQIIEIPENMDRYYPDNYYSYQNPSFATKLTGLRFQIKKSLAAYCQGRFNLTGFLLSLYYENPFTWLKPNMATFKTKILDVGCGAGRLLISMQRSGYNNLTGIDPYNKEDIFYDNGVTVYKKEIFEVTEKYDLIMLHHSFEHMGNPKDILTKLHELINPQGYIVIRIPVANCFAWRKYHNHWVQLDAPRHFFLHTIKSMTLLANECALKLSNVEYESTAFQFTGSEKYLRGIGFKEKENFTKKQMRVWKREANRLNHINDGDTACFYLQKVQ
jgi:2-polyprenyl-3-methyl-5-hydroxy-6-metoxy-1,4-benzoquinol methylase